MNNQCTFCREKGHVVRDCTHPNKKPPAKNYMELMPSGENDTETDRLPAPTAPALPRFSITKLSNSADQRADLLIFAGTFHKHPVRILIDGVASASFIDDDFCHRFDIQAASKHDPDLIRLADGHQHQSTAMIPNARFRMASYKGVQTLHCTTLHGFDIILGKPWLAELNPHIDWKQNTMTFNHAGRKHTLRAPPPAKHPDIDKYTISTAGLRVAIHTRQPMFLVSITPTGGDTTTETHQAMDCTAITQRFPDVFPSDLPAGLPPQRAVDHRIEVEPGKRPPTRPTYNMSTSELAELKAQITEMQEKGFIRPSTSPYAAGVLFVRKKDSTFRMCVDYRPLNRITIKNKYPLPRVENMLDRLHGATVFSKIDLRQGYHQIRISPEDIPKTAFSTRYGHFEFTVLPFGLCNAPGTFQRLMNDIFRQELDDHVIIYLDDILIFSRTHEEHAKHLDRPSRSAMATSPASASGNQATILDDDNWPIWSIRTEGLLIEAGLWSVVTDGVTPLPTAPAPNATQEERAAYAVELARSRADSALDRKAKAFIQRHVSNLHIFTVKSADSAQDAWETLESQFTESSVARQSQLQQQLSLLRMEPGESVARFYARLQQLLTELEACNCETSESTVVLAILAALPPEYESTVERLRYDQTSADLKVERIKRVLLTKEADLLSKQMQQQLSTSSSSLWSYSSPSDSRGAGSSGGQGGRGRFRLPQQQQQQQQQQARAQSPDRSTRDVSSHAHLTCNYCAKLGHIMSECFTFDRDQRNRMRTLFSNPAKPSSPGRRPSPGRSSSPARTSSPSRGRAQTPGRAAAQSPSRGASLFTCSTAAADDDDDDDLDDVLMQMVQPRLNFNSDLYSPFCIDSGASYHILKDLQFFYNYTPFAPNKHRPVRLAAEGHRVWAVGSGSVFLSTKRGSWFLSHALYVPDSKQNFISVTAATDDGSSFLFRGDVCQISCNQFGSMLRVNAHKVRNSYILAAVPMPDGPDTDSEPEQLYNVQQSALQPDPRVKLELLTNVAAPSANSATSDSPQVWHQRLCHTSYDALARMQSAGMVSGVPVTAAQFRAAASDPAVCVGCVKGKQHKNVAFAGPPPNAAPVTAPLGLIHMDVCGPMHARARDGSLYVATFLDEHTKLSVCVPISSKAQVPDTVRTVIEELETQSGYRCKAIRTDNGTEYVNSRMREYCASKGIVHQHSAPYSPQQNGAAERLNRTIFEKARSIIHSADISLSFWAHAVKFANHVRCLLPVSGQPLTPWEAFYGVKPDLSGLRVFGCRVWLHVPDHQRSKLQAKSVEGLFIGYEPGSKAYKVLVNGRETCSKDIVFDELSVLQPARQQDQPAQPVFLLPLPPSPSTPSEPLAPAAPAEGGNSLQQTSSSSSEDSGSSSSISRPSSSAQRPQSRPLEGVGAHQDSSSSDSPPSEQEPSQQVSLTTRHEPGSHMWHQQQLELISKLPRPGIGRFSLRSMPLARETVGAQPAAAPAAARPAAAPAAAKSATARPAAPAAAPAARRAAPTAAPPAAPAAVRPSAAAAAPTAARPAAPVTAVARPAAAARPGLAQPALRVPLIPTSATARQAAPAVHPSMPMPPAPDPRPASPEAPAAPVPRRNPSRERHRPERFRDSDLFAMNVSDSPVNDTPTVAEALAGPMADLWIEAMNAELASLHANQTWCLEERPANARVLPTKWVLKVKRDAAGNIEKLKARLVAKGFYQQSGVDVGDVYAPVSKHTTLRTLLAKAAAENMEIHQLDFETAFLNGKLEPGEVIYVQQPEGFEEGSTNTVCRLQKALYGLRQAPRAWHARLCEELLSMGFKASEADPALFTLQLSTGMVYLLVYVDDCLLCTQQGDTAGLAHVKKQLSSAFKLKDLGEARWFLGMQLTRDRAEGTIKLDQHKFIQELVTANSKSAAHSKPLPMAPAVKLVREGDALDTTLHHYSALGFSDADYAGDKDTARSTTGYIFTLNGGAISWSSRLQPTVAMSTAEAEYMAASSAAKEALWLRKLMRDLCKVRTSGRDCRFASSGLSRECEPSRDAGYTCSVRFGRLKTSDIAFARGQQLAEEEELLDEFGLDQFDSTATPVDELNAQIATLQAQLVAAQANNQQAGSLQFLEFVGEDLTTDADAARAKLLDSTHLRMTNGVALSAYITDFRNTLTLAGKDCMTDSMLVNVFQRGLSADLRGPVAKDLRALVAPTLDEAIKAAITNPKALVAAAGSGVHPASRRPVAAVHQVAQVQRGLQNLARFPGPPPGRPAAPSADSEGPPPASGYCYHCGLSSHWTKHCKRKASGMSKEEAMKDAGTWELMQDLKKGGSAPYKAAKRDRSPDRGDFDVLLGNDWLNEHEAVMSYQDKTLSLACDKGEPVVLPCTPADKSESGQSAVSNPASFLVNALRAKPPLASAKVAARWLRKGGTGVLALITVDNSSTPDPAPAEPDLPPGVSQALNALLDEYADVFAPITSLPPERPVGHAIPLVPDARPSVVPQYRMSQEEHAELKKQVQDLLAKGMIEPSSSPFAAPILFVKKKSGELRMCLDYRQLNKITIRDQYPLPRIDDLFDKLSGCTVFSSLDLQAGYNQIRITPEDVPKTAFRTPDGHYQFKVLSFGLCNAPATFQRVMNDAFAPVLNQCALVYLDDILVMSKSVDEHLKHLRKVFDLLRLNKLFAKQSKCEFMRTTLKFLGHVIFAGAIAVDPEKIKSISSWPVPQSLQQLQSFLGAANFVRKFVHNFSVLAAPLTDLCGKAGDSFLWHNWPADELKAFASLKAAVAQVPMLRLPDHTQPFQVYCDASLQGVGAVLMQDGYPLAYLSKKLSSAERNYTTGEQELLALITACKEWRCYLEGVPFTLFTDHKPLTALPTQKVLSRRQARWMEFLSRFTFDLQYLPGDANPADPLSRIPAGPQDCAMVCVVTTRQQAKQSLERGEVRVAQALPQVPPVGTPSNAPTAVDALAPRPTVSDNPVAAHHSRLPELEAPSAADTSVHYPAAPAHPLELADHLVHGYRLDPAFTAEADLSGMYMDDHGLWRRTGKGTVMVPNDPELREYILHEMHDAAYAGHVGITKTLERLSRVFYWDTMRSDVRHYVTTCDACQRDKSSTLKPGGLLNPLSIPDYRWESVSMDLITKLPSASHGFDAICVFVDRLSKMVHFVPCKESMNAKGFARLFVDNVFKLHGLPKDMVSDRGPHFHNTFWHHVQKLLGMRGSLSSSYHPQSDGQTERYNRVLEEMLRHYISPTQADWPDYLSLAEFAVNNSWQESIKSTPFLVNTGQSPITPMLHSLPDKGRCPEGLSYATWWQEAVAKAKLCMQAAQQRQAAYANQDRRDVHYKVGQMVLLSTKNMRLKPGKARKLLPRFVGPFKVLDLVGQVAVNLQLPASMSRLHPVFHVSLIKPYTGTDVGFMPPPVEWLDEEPVYYVERKAKEYLVQWEGYDADHNTWEPRSNLVGCDKILAEYNAAHNLNCVHLGCDNQAAIQLLHNPMATSRAKHIDVHHHFVRERISRGEVAFHYCHTSSMLADILTKPLAAVQFNMGKQGCGVFS
ncbi:hypothetical protein QJQ45_029304 [Haematococcus lacustris]|nr:hypothetical protein QJQ45_029304 [Haematococcus lacustris]